MDYLTPSCYGALVNLLLLLIVITFSLSFFASLPPVFLLLRTDFAADFKLHFESHLPLLSSLPHTSLHHATHQPPPPSKHKHKDSKKTQPYASATPQFLHAPVACRFGPSPPTPSSQRLSEAAASQRTECRKDPRVKYVRSKQRASLAATPFPCSSHTSFVHPLAFATHMLSKDAHLLCLLRTHSLWVASSAAHELRPPLVPSLPPASTGVKEPSNYPAVPRTPALHTLLFPFLTRPLSGPAGLAPRGGTCGSRLPSLSPSLCPERGVRACTHASIPSLPPN